MSAQAKKKAKPKGKKAPPRKAPAATSRSSRMPATPTGRVPGRCPERPVSRIESAGSRSPSRAAGSPMSPRTTS